MNNLVSIVLPVYNGEKFLRQSIDSILSQTYTNWELIIMDDCSTDSTAQIAAEYVQTDRRITYHKNEKNLRLPRNLNAGFRLARGGYLTWHSDDNLFLPTALEKMIAALQQHSNAHFVFASCQYIDEFDNFVDNFIVTERSNRGMVGINGVRACFMYTRKAYETVGEYDPDCVLVEDYDYWQRLTATFDTIAIPEILYSYRVHSTSLTGTMNRAFFNQQLEKTLLKNRPLFGRLTTEQKYYFYAGLYDCRISGNASKNPYRPKYYFYRTVRNLYLFFLKITGKSK